MMPQLTSENTINVLHSQAWARAKGELACMLIAIYDDGLYYDKLEGLIQDFVTKVEDLK